MKRYSQKSLDKRKEERKDFPEFFQRHVKKIRDNNLCCEECGGALRGDVSEVAHILPKQTFKSISAEDSNIIYLCGWKQNNCHANFDNGSNDKIKTMKIFEKVCILFENLLPLITEKITYKTVDRYTK